MSSVLQSFRAELQPDSDPEQFVLNIGYADGTTGQFGPFSRVAMAIRLKELLSLVGPTPKTAEEYIAVEVALQNKLFGGSPERTDVVHGELVEAALAHIIGLLSKQNGNPYADGFEFYPWDESAFRDYGSDIANLVVAAAYLTNEIKRKLALHEDTTRSQRETPYAAIVPVLPNAQS